MTEQRLPNDDELMRVLNAHPQIKNRLASMLAVVQDAAGELKEADAAERRPIEEVRLIGQEAMQSVGTDKPKINFAGKAVTRLLPCMRLPECDCPGHRHRYRGTKKVDG